LLSQALLKAIEFGLSIDSLSVFLFFYFSPPLLISVSRHKKVTATPEVYEFQAPFY
jgi:hypothetical protein